MKKSFISKIILYSFLFLIINSFIIDSVALRVDKWSKVVDEEGINSAFVFYFYLHSWFETEHLEENEFLFGDVIDFCYIYIIERKPIDLEIKPERIKFTSPSKEIYEINLTGKDDYFRAGKFTRSKEDALIILNESGIWAINIIFNDETPLSLISSVDSEVFTNDSEIHIYYGSNINIYTNLEYQQLKAAKALEESAKAAESSKTWAIYSFIALSCAAFIAALSIIFNYLHKRREINAECKFKVLEHLLNLRDLIRETYTFIDKIKSNDYQYIVSVDSKTYENIRERYYDLRKKLSPGVAFALTFPEAKKLKKILNKMFIQLYIFTETPLENLKSPTKKEAVDEAKKDLKEIEKLITEFLKTKIKIYGIS